MPTTQQVAGDKPHPNGELPNPTGKGGFGEHPENRNPGGWDKTQSISYQYNRLMRMRPQDLETFQPQTVAEQIALNRIKESNKSLPDVKEITDRTEGKAPQAIDMTSSDGSMTPVVIIESVYANKPKFRPETPQANDLAEDSSEQSS